MILLIDNKVAAVKKDASIEYNATNRLFGEREDYTLNIELPLDNKENMRIFGRLDRLDAEVNDIFLDAEIIDGNFRKSGAVAITSITESMVKVQFLADRSFQNFYPEFDKKFIDELDLPQIPKWLPDNLDEQSNGYTGSRNGGGYSGSSSGRAGRGGGGRGQETDYTQQTSEYKSPQDVWGTDDIIALPWVNAESGNIQNRADYGDRNGTYKHYWHVAAESDDDTETVNRLSCQIRLYKLTEIICDALGYSLSAQAWVGSDYYYLYSFNCVPAAWEDQRWQDTLPHWSINEFFENLEKLMLCNITIDHKKKSVTFSWQESSMGDTVELENVVEEHTATVTKDDESEYRPAKNISYANAGHNMSNIYSCDWYFRKYNPNVREFESMQELANWLVTYAPRQGTNEDLYMGAGQLGGLFYVQDEDMYFMAIITKRVLVDPAKHEDFAKYGNIIRMVPVNAFGTRIVDEEHWEESEEIGIIPAWLDDTDKGLLPFFNPGTTSGGDMELAESYWGRDGDEIPADQIIQYMDYKRVKRGDAEQKASMSTLQVAFWYGMSQRTWGNEDDLPRPFVTRKEFVTVWSYTPRGDHHADWGQWQVVLNPGNGSLRLNTSLYGMGAKMEEWISIDPKTKYEISFLSNELPDVKSVFVIHGKRYLCASIRTEITTDGMSQLKKGTFYRITS